MAGPEDVTIDIKYCGICHSDVHWANNDMGKKDNVGKAGWINLNSRILDLQKAFDDFCGKQRHLNTLVRMIIVQEQSTYMNQLCPYVFV